MITQRAITLALVGGSTALATGAATAHAQALPAPKPLVSGLDLECYKTPGPALNIDVKLTQLNRVLLGLGLPPQIVTIRELAQTCVPVRKNAAIPGPGVLPFIEQVDFGCYRVDAAPIAPIPLNLTHLNPVLANLPQHDVTLTRPAQLCLPIAKNGILPDPNVLALVRFIDLACYQLDPAPHPQFTVNLTQLNPQLGAIAPHPMTLVSSPRQLCVPVRKNAQMIPDAIANLVQWIDLEKFAASPTVPIPPVNVVLRHLNPLFTGLPPIPVVLEEAIALMVPVAKNATLPPAQ